MTSFGVISSTIVRCKNLRMNALMMFITMKNVELFRIDLPQFRKILIADLFYSISVIWIFSLHFLGKKRRKIAVNAKLAIFKNNNLYRVTLLFIYILSSTLEKKLKGFWSIFILKTWHISNVNGNFTDHWLCFQVIWIAHTSEQTTLTLVI